MKGFAAAVVLSVLLPGLGAVRAQGADYAIDPTHTFVSFEATHFGTRITRGRWNRKEGSVQFDRAARTGRAEITLDMASISTGVPPFDQQLQGQDFFDTATHPTARFVGERFVFDGDQVAAVHGTLTMRGKTQPLALTAQRFNCYTNPLFKREVCGGDFEATIQPALWGIGSAVPAAVPDRVRLLVQIEAIKQ